MVNNIYCSLCSVATFGLGHTESFFIITLGKDLGAQSTLINYLLINSLLN